MGLTVSKTEVPPVGELLERIDDLVLNNHIMIFSKRYCPYCVQVKSLFKKLEVDYHVLEFNDEEHGPALQDALQQKTGQRTVPNVFIAGKHIGGCDNVKALHQQGKLVELVKQE